LHQYKPLDKFHIDQNFIYITGRKDERKEELHFYYKLTDEDMEEIRKEWPVEVLVPIDDEELFDPDIIVSPMVTQVEHIG
jgi:hypothetical protein